MKNESITAGTKGDTLWRHTFVGDTVALTAKCSSRTDIQWRYAPHNILGQ